MRKVIIKTLKGPHVTRAIRERKALYENCDTRESIARYQTIRFNEVWAAALQDSPFYREWAERHSLPRQIEDIREVSYFPVLQKRHLVEHSERLLSSTSHSFYVSGGSTGTPTRFPKRNSEGIIRYANNVLTHSWLGLSPGDRYIHLWGHAHLFGQGSLAQLRKRVRKTKDWIVGGYRLNAYNQSRTDIQNWIAAIMRVRPKYIVGYSSALVNLASEIENTSSRINISSLEWIICTAETIAPIDVDRLQWVFGVPVAVEYGANEAGVIAHSHPYKGDRLQFLWGSLAGNADQDGSLNLSTLDSRAFPLINYEIGDRIEDPDTEKHVLSFRSILGRVSEQISLEMSDGSIGSISMVGVVGALKTVTGVRTVQAAQLRPGAAEIYLTGTYELNPEGMQELFLRELGTAGVHVHPKALSFKHLREPVKSLAGKTNLLVQSVIK